MPLLELSPGRFCRQMVKVIQYPCILSNSLETRLYSLLNVEYEMSVEVACSLPREMVANEWQVPR